MPAYFLFLGAKFTSVGWMLLLTLNNDRALSIGCGFGGSCLQGKLCVAPFPRYSMFSLTEPRGASRFCFLSHPLNAKVGTSIHVLCRLTSGKNKRHLDVKNLQQM